MSKLLSKDDFGKVRRELIALVANGVKRTDLGPNVRLGDGIPYSDGFMSPLVADLGIELHVVLKLGGEEIVEQAALMEELFRTTQPRLTPAVLGTFPLGDGRHGMLIERLEGYRSLYTLVYEDPRPTSAVAPIVTSAMQQITQHLSVGLRRRTIELPYVHRIRTRLAAARKRHGAAVVMGPVTIGGGGVPPLQTSLRVLAAASRRVCVPVRRAHGDLHLGNILVREQVRRHRLRLIDPNPAAGETDYLFDVGKLYHWLDVLGYINHEARRSKGGRRGRRAFDVTVADGRMTWAIRTGTGRRSGIIERRRQMCADALDREIQRLGHNLDDATMSWRLPLAIASAHAGLMAVVEPRRHFLLAFCRLRQCVAEAHAALATR